MSQTKTFHPFVRLPIELRLKIWELSHSLFPRIIEIRKYLPNAGHFRDVRRPTWYIVPSIQLVPLLLINYEARNEFQLAGNRIFNRARFTQRAAEFRFNFEYDTIYWNMRHPFLYQTPEEREQNARSSPGEAVGWEFCDEVFGLCSGLVQKNLRSIAGDDLWNFNGLRHKEFRKFVALEEAILVFEDDDPGRLIGWSFDDYQVINRMGMISVSAYNFNTLRESDHWVKRGTKFKFAAAIREPLEWQ